MDEEELERKIKELERIHFLAKRIPYITVIVSLVATTLIVIEALIFN